MCTSASIAKDARGLLTWLNAHTATVRGDERVPKRYRGELLKRASALAVNGVYGWPSLTPEQVDGAELLIETLGADPRELRWHKHTFETEKQRAEQLMQTLRKDPRKDPWRLHRWDWRAALRVLRWPEPSTVPSIRTALSLLASTKPTRTSKTGKRAKRPKKTEPTQRDMEVYSEWLKVQSYRKVGETFDISATAVGNRVRFVKEYLKPSRSVRAQQLPHDARGQVTANKTKGKQTKRT